VEIGGAARKVTHRCLDMAVPLSCLRPVQVWRRLLYATVGDGAVQTLHRRLRDEPPPVCQPPCSCSLGPGFWLFCDALQVTRMHQARPIKAIKLNEIIAWRAVQDLPNHTQRSPWNEL